MQRDDNDLALVSAAHPRDQGRNARDVLMRYPDEFESRPQPAMLEGDPSSCGDELRVSRLQPEVDPEN